jgi:hypothetical protein
MDMHPFKVKVTQVARPFEDASNQLNYGQRELITAAPAAS